MLYIQAIQKVKAKGTLKNTSFFRVAVFENQQVNYVSSRSSVRTWTDYIRTSRVVPRYPYILKPQK